MTVAAGVVVRRHARPTQFPISPREISENPGRGIRELLMGCFWVSDHTVAITSRGYYGSIENHFQTGPYSYNIQIIIPDSKKELLREITVVRDEQYYGYDRAIELPLSDVVRPGEFSSIKIPDKRIVDLLPFTIISGGIADSSEPLQPLFVGMEAQGSLKEEINQEGTPLWARK